MAGVIYGNRRGIIAERSGSTKWWGNGGIEWGLVYLDGEPIPGVVYDVSPHFSTETKDYEVSTTETSKFTVTERDGRTIVNRKAEPRGLTSSQKAAYANYATKVTKKTFPTTNNPTSVTVASMLWTGPQYDKFVELFAKLHMGPRAQKVGIKSHIIDHPLLRHLGVSDVIIKECDVSPPLITHDEFFVVNWTFETVRNPEETSVELTKGEIKDANESAKSELPPPTTASKASGQRAPAATKGPGMDSGGIGMPY